MPDIIEVIASGSQKQFREKSQGVVTIFYSFEFTVPSMPILRLSEEEATDEEFEAYLIDTGHDTFFDDDDDIYTLEDGRPLE